MRTVRLAAAHDLEVRHTLFPLHPDTPPEGLTLEELFGGRIDVEESQERMGARLEEGGLPFATRTHTYNSRKAQELAKWAETLPSGSRIHDALFHAYFAEARNLADVEVLMDVVRRLELPVEEARSALQQGLFEEAVDLDWARSRRLGITGVPTFLIGRTATVGAQPYEVLERLVEIGKGDTRPDSR